jgi:hypothetical protein
MGHKKATHYVVYVLARVHSAACVDMLRYDSCCPASERESGELEHALRTGEATWVIMRRFVQPGAPEDPTVERWRSFNAGCHPKALQTYHAAAALREAMKER